MVEEEEVVVEKETSILDDENELDRDREIVDSKKLERKKDKKMRRFLKEAALADKRGVCYLSRVPPHMNPLKLRQILSQYGEIQRIYLVPEGGKRRSSFYYDLWNIKYLKKFKWDDLTEEIAHKNATREQKLALEISAAKRERDFYLSKVDQSRALSSIRERAKKKLKSQEGLDSNASMSDVVEPKVIRCFKQTQPVVDTKSKPTLSKDLLAGIFGGS